MARETVDRATPAASATSAIVGRAALGSLASISAFLSPLDVLL
jgi:hypothetical protein